MIYKHFNKLHLRLYPQKLKTGKISIRIRITVKGKRDNIISGIVLDNSVQWNNPVVRSHKFAKQYNDRLTQIQMNLLECFNRLESLGKNPTAYDVKLAFKGETKPPVTVLEVFNNLILDKEIESKLKRGITKNTVKKYRVIYNDLLTFLESNSLKTLPAAKFNIKLGKDFFTFLRQKNNSELVAIKKITKLQTAFKNAVDDEVLSSNLLKNLDIRVTEKAKKIDFLYPNEILLIESKMMPLQRLQEEKDVFLFQCAVGLSDSDLRIFAKNPKSFLFVKSDATWLCMTRTKTDTSFEIPLFETARKLLEKYNYELPVKALGNRNAYLKEIGVLCGITRIILTTHVARRSFATILLNFEKVPLERVSRFLGHSSINTTMKHYAAVIPEQSLPYVQHLL